MSVGCSLPRQSRGWGPGSDNLLAAQVGSSTDSTFYAIKDKLGSIRGWVRKDGTWRWSMRYRPYGAGLDSTGTALDVPYRWTGRENDPETGFYYLRARYYDPGIGRFTQEDPIGLAGGRNLYAYVDGQPLEARDPSGLLKDNAVYGDYSWCSPESGRCLSSSGSMLGDEYWWMGGGGGAGGGHGFVDSNGDGKDDFKEFADEAWDTQQLFYMNKQLEGQVQGQSATGSLNEPGNPFEGIMGMPATMQSIMQFVAFMRLREKIYELSRWVDRMEEKVAGKCTLLGVAGRTAYEHGRNESEAAIILEAIYFFVKSESSGGVAALPSVVTYGVETANNYFGCTR